MHEHKYLWENIANDLPMPITLKNHKTKPRNHLYFLPSITLAASVGLWSLLAQFIFNRVIFFYIANSEYVAATIITIHLAGFWMGTLAARRWSLPILPLVALSLLTTIAANIAVWRLGAPVLGLPLTVSLAVMFGLLLAGLSGALIVRLMSNSNDNGRGVIIADSAGSVIGAALGGFVLIPQFGLTVTFACALVLQSIVLSVLLIRSRVNLAAKILLYFPVMAALGLILSVAPYQAKNFLVVDGLPIKSKEFRAGGIAYSSPSPFGLVTVVLKDDSSKELLIDNRPLCDAKNGELQGLSEWMVGEQPMTILNSVERPKMRAANIGLGCGVTAAAMLADMPADGKLDIIEINPKMPDAQKLFWPELPHTPEDERVEMHIADGFGYFGERKETRSYDAVVIDLAWMQNMNATHLFSKEMYENVARNLAEDGVLGIWSEEFNPFSPVSLIIYRTLREVFPHVVVDASHSAVLFYASKSRWDMTDSLAEGSSQLTNWVAQVAASAPVNRLDDLVMNRHKFTLFGDSTFDRLFSQYPVSPFSFWKEENDENKTP